MQARMTRKKAMSLRDAWRGEKEMASRVGERVRSRELRAREIISSILSVGEYEGGGKKQESRSPTVKFGDGGTMGECE